MDCTLENPSESGASARLRLAGEVTIESAAELKKILLAALETGSDLLVDCSQATSLDLSALQLLCAAHRTACSLGKTMTLDERSGEVLAQAVGQAGFLRQRACLLSPQERACLWLPRADG